MVAIEFKRVLKESIIIFLVLVGLLIAILTTNIDIYLGPVFEIFLLLYASFTGWSIFDKERNEGAMEYLLSLPVSRVRLFFIKLMPRLVSVGLLLVFYMLLHSSFEFPSLLSVLDFSIFYFAFFLVSLSLSLSLKSFIGAFFLTGLLSGGLTLFNRVLAIGKSDSTVYFQSNISLLIFPVLFFIMFHSYDVKPSFSFNMKFTGLGIACLILIVGINYLTVGQRWCQCFLTDKGDILKITPGQTRLINKEQKIIKRFPGSQIPLLPKGTSLYVEKRKNYGTAGSIDLLNLESGETESLHQIPKGWRVMFDSIGRTGILKEDNFYFLLGNWEEKSYKIVEITTAGSKEIPLTGNFNFSKEKESWYEVSLVYVLPGASGFIINHYNTLYRVEETGNAAELFKMEFLSLWKNRLLVFDETGMTLFEISAQGEFNPIFKKEGHIRKIRRRFGHIFAKKVLVRDHEQGKYFIFSLEDLNFTEIPMPYNPYFYLEKQDRFVIVWASGNEMAVGEFKDGQLVMKKEWVTHVPIKGYRIVRVCNPGVVIFNRKEFETYWFD
jgi:hypothetical protein